MLSVRKIEIATSGPADKFSTRRRGQPRVASLVSGLPETPHGLYDARSLGLAVFRGISGVQMGGPRFLFSIMAPGPSALSEPLAIPQAWAAD